MAERSVIVRLGANISDYQREMAKAKTPLDELVKKSGDASGEASTLMGRLAQSARLQSAEWRTAGTSLVAAGAAITGMSVAVAKTGISYNTLQQTSRAAMRTIMGSAAEANAQMDKLDEFARTSPFSKAVFLEAQQQMLGFGIEARKVVPYLDAIQNAVAATGGSNQDIAELTRIFSQIQSSAKITAQDLMQFGTRGVDAASLIGSQMGKTASQIREDITSGAIDAGAALDALAAGMQDRFGGAAAGVKDTFEGALDRVKAAFRDLSASIMSSAVDPDGGGWLVDLTNSVADAIRMLDELPAPVKQSAAAITGIGGAAAVAVGGLMLMVPRVWETHQAWAALSETFPGATRGIRLAGRAAGIAAAGIAAAGIAASLLVDETRPVGDFAEALAKAAREGGNLAALNLALPQRQIRDIQISAQNLGEAFETIQFYTPDDGLSGFLQRANQDFVAVLESLTGFKSAATEAEESLARVGTELAAMDAEAAARAFQLVAAELQAAGASAEDVVNLLPDYANVARVALTDLANELGGPVWDTSEALVEIMSGDLPAGLVMTSEGIMTVQQAAELGADGMGEMAAAGDDLEMSMSDIIRASEDARRAIDDLNRSQRDGANAWMDMERAGDRYRDTLSDLSDQIKQNGTSLDENSEKGRANRAYIRDLAGQARDYTDAMLANGSSVDDVNAKMSEQREELLKVLQRFGVTGDAAQDYADQLGLIPNYVETLIAVPGATLSTEQARNLNRELADTPDEVKSQIIIAANRDGYDEAMRLLEQARGRRVTSYIDIVTRQQIQRGTDPRVHNLHQADGGVVDYYASGGLRESHVAQIAPAGSWRVWAEPETGGEAYIPLAASKRARSMEIWRETGSRLGVPREWLDAARFNQGGFAGSYSAASSAPMRVSASVDQAAITAAVAAGLSGARIVMDGRVVDARIETGISQYDHSAAGVRR